MTELHALRLDNVALRQRNEELVRRALDAEQAVAALARGEVDAVVIEASATPVLLHAAQAQLRGSRQLLRAVFDGALDAIVLADDRGVFVDANPAASALLLLPRDRVIGRNFTEFVVTDHNVPLGFEEFRTGGGASGQFTLQRPDGTQCIVDYSAVANVTPGLHLAVLRDITARKLSEEAVRASRDLMEEAQAIAHVGSWTSGFGPAGVIEWSRECYRIYGIPEGTPMTVASFVERVHPDDRARVQAATRAAIDDGAPAEIEHRIVRLDGRVSRVHQRGVVERDATGQALRMYGTLQDITDRYAAVEALRESEQRYRRMVENTTEGVWMFDAAGITTFMNGRMAQMLGWTVEETVGRPMLAFMTEANGSAGRERTALRQRGVAERGDFHLACKDGTQLWVSIQANPLFDAEGRYEAALCLVTDVSAERRADEVRAHLAAIVESSKDAIVSTNLDGIVTSWNEGAEKLYGYTAGEIVGTSISVLIPGTAAGDEAEMFQRVGRGESPQQFESVRIRKGGSRVDVAITISPVRGADGNVIGVSKIARDLTAQRAAEDAHRQIEDQFRQAQKMEAVGRLAGGVAHDFNNLLTVILSYSEFAIEDLKTGDPLRDDMIQIKQAAVRASALTRQLLAFSRQQVLQPRVVELDQILVEMSVMLRRLLGEDVELRLSTAPDLGRINADRGQLEQVVMNLAVNARDAMLDGGTLSIDTADLHLDHEYVGGLSRVPPGDYVVLTVTDTGDGMDAATCARIFEPFFTTKEPGKGTGLGLSTVFGIVRQSGGYIAVDSEPGRGTTFKAYFPRTERVADAPIAASSAAMLRGTETVLLVEDEEQVRNVACAILRRNGYHVLDTANGGEAFLISKEFAGTIDLLFTDVVMPRMNGRRLAEQLTEQRPAMKVLFASGYTDDAMVHHGVRDAGAAFLQKPFTPDALLRKVRSALDRA